MIIIYDIVVVITIQICKLKKKKQTKKNRKPPKKSVQLPTGNKLNIYSYVPAIY